jgi:hypothetical protein
VQISRLLGHHSPSFTLSVYAHLMDEGSGGPLDLGFDLQANGANPFAHMTPAYSA